MFYFWLCEYDVLFRILINIYKYEFELKIWKYLENKKYDCVFVWIKRKLK